MKIFELSQIQEAKEYTPQIERFINGVIYVIEQASDYTSLPLEIQTWRQMEQWKG